MCRSEALPEVLSGKPIAYRDATTSAKAIINVYCSRSGGFIDSRIERQRAIVAEHIRYENEHNWPAVHDTFVQDNRAFYDVIPLQTTFKGIDGVRQFYAVISSAVPDLHIAVSARKPVAAVVHENLVYLDESGACFAKPEQSPVADLPYVSGLTQLSLDSPSARSALEGVLRLLSLSRLWQEPLSEIHWDPQQGYTLFLERRRVTIRLGWETAPEKFAQIGIVLAEWREDAPAAIFDARFAGQIVVRAYAEEKSTPNRALSRPL